MSLSDKKITAFTTSIAALPDKIENNAAWLKAQFDGRTDKEVKDSINGIIDELCGEDAAAQIGAKVPLGLSANGNIQSILYALREFIDQKMIEIGAGDMQKSIYDTNDNGIVDNAERLCGKTADEFATAEQGENAMPKAGGTFTGEISAPGVSINTADGSVWLNAGTNPEGTEVKYRFHANGGVMWINVYVGGSIVSIVPLKITADGIADLQGHASDDMPKSGGIFTGNVTAYGTNRAANSLRNCVVQNTSGTAQSTNYLIFRRK